MALISAAVLISNFGWYMGALDEKATDLLCGDPNAHSPAPSSWPHLQAALNTENATNVSYRISVFIIRRPTNSNANRAGRLAARVIAPPIMLLGCDSADRRSSSGPPLALRVHPLPFAAHFRHTRTAIACTQGAPEHSSSAFSVHKCSNSLIAVPPIAHIHE